MRHSMSNTETNFTSRQPTACASGRASALSRWPAAWRPIGNQKSPIEDLTGNLFALRIGDGAAAPTHLIRGRLVALGPVTKITTNSLYFNDLDPEIKSIQKAARARPSRPHPQPSPASFRPTSAPQNRRAGPFMERAARRITELLIS